MILRRKSAVFLACMTILACSDVVTERPFQLEGRVEGKVVLYTEFLGEEVDQSGAKVSLEGGEEAISVVTDTDGRYTLDGIPTGTYTLRIEKNGFSPNVRKAFGVIGGPQPLYAWNSLARFSTTKVDNLVLSTSNSQMLLSGIITHNAPYPSARLVVFLGNTPDVSPEKHLSSHTMFTDQASGSEISLRFYASPSLFPTGSTLYVVACGYAGIGQFNPDTGLYEYSGLGDPSEVASILIP